MSLYKRIQALVTQYIVFSVVALVLLTIAVPVARYYYLLDTYGLRTAMHRRNPTDFERKVFTEEFMDESFLPYANFRHANLNEVHMRDSNLRYADFTDANLKSADLGHSDLSHAIFHRAFLRNVRWLDSSTFRNASFRETDISWVSFHGMGGRNRPSKPKHLLDPSSGGADLTDAIFEGAICQHTIFSRCLLVRANFRGADCREANFNHADLRNADFTGADLRDAEFEGADTTGAIFTNAKR